MPDLEILTGGYTRDTLARNETWNPKKLLLIWPSTGGNARSFRIRESELKERKILLIRFNPASHGDSSGNYDPKQAIDDLLKFLKLNQFDQIPTIGIGHSGGGAALIMMQDKLSFVKRYLLSPILDSRLSLFYLYENGHIEEFLQLLFSDLSSGFEPELIKEREKMTRICLQNSAWLIAGNVESLNFPVKNSRIQLNDLALLLKDIFLPGFDITRELSQVTSPVRIFLPRQDFWFPLEKTMEFRSENRIEITEIGSAKDHFFTSAWLVVWKEIQTEIFCDD